MYVGSFCHLRTYTHGVRGPSRAGYHHHGSRQRNPGFSGDGGSATKTQLDIATGIAVDAARNIYIADSYNNRICKVNSAGIITTIAGTSVGNVSGNGGPATSARLQVPRGIAVDHTGDLYISDTNNNRARKIGTAAVITTFAGNGEAKFSGEGSSVPYNVAIDNMGNVYIAAQSFGRTRKGGGSALRQSLVEHVAANAR
jgi:sugar lactone lactonase YvrE